MMICRTRNVLRNQQVYHNRDARPLSTTRLLSMGQVPRKRAREDPEAESSLAKKRSLLDLRHYAFTADKSGEKPRPTAGLGDE